VPTGSCEEIEIAKLVKSLDSPFFDVLWGHVAKKPLPISFVCSDVRLVGLYYGRALKCYDHGLYEW